MPNGYRFRLTLFHCLAGFFGYHFCVAGNIFNYRKQLYAMILISFGGEHPNSLVSMSKRPPPNRSENPYLFVFVRYYFVIVQNGMKAEK